MQVAPFYFHYQTSAALSPLRLVRIPPVVAGQLDVQDLRRNGMSRLEVRSFDVQGRNQVVVPKPARWFSIVFTEVPAHQKNPVLVGLVVQVVAQPGARPVSASSLRPIFTSMSTVTTIFPLAGLRGKS